MVQVGRKPRKCPAQPPMQSRVSSEVRTSCSGLYPVCLKALEDGEYTGTLGNCLTVLMGETFVLLSGVYLSFQFVPLASHSPCTTVNSVAPSLPPIGISRRLVGALKPSLPQAQQVQLPQPLFIGKVLQPPTILVNLC